MDLSTQYLGLKLKNPLVASASPLSESIDNYRRLEDAGIAAVVNYSLFEEQITRETMELNYHLTTGTESFAESLTYFPEPEDFVLGPEEYLKHIARAKEAVGIPVIGSLNGCSPGGWTKYARLIEEAGADAVELNIYFLSTNPEITGEQIEKRYIEILQLVKSQVKIPVAVKLSPFFSSFANMAKRLDEAGADGFVLFNRFFQPDIDLEQLEVAPNMQLSTPYDLRLPLRWIAVLYGKVDASLAATRGVHDATDALKMLMVGADVSMVCSTLLKNGIGYARKILDEIKEWMERNEYESIKQMRGSMSQKACANPEAFERANYMKVLRSYRMTL